MSSSNWQDTAMHSGIIESISQGNFPPQAPYFSGVPLNYYYFTDFHSSILETMYGRFFPRVLVYDNPFFAFILAILVYFTTYELTRNRKISVLSLVLAPFIGNYMFVDFVNDLTNGLGKAKDLIATKGYAIEFGGMFQVSPMADYFLQNRPMMVGLPAFVAVLLLSIFLFRKKIPGVALLAGFIAGALIKFQLFSSLISVGAFFVVSMFYFSLRRHKLFFQSAFYFLTIYLIFVLIFATDTNVNQKSLVLLVAENFSWGPWERGKDLSWYLEFVSKNLGFPFVIVTLSFFVKKSRAFWAITVIALALTVIPFAFRFTIMKYDMLKFIYFASIIYSLVVFWVLRKIVKNNYIFWTLFSLIIVTSSLTSFLNLGNSYLNKTMAYTQNEIDSGFWIRENTPPKSVFLDLANLHSPITEVAGRLRVLSYINWPHSHGYNVGSDNVFSRLEDIKNVYAKGDLTAIAKYNVDYVYWGRMERDGYPGAEKILESSTHLTKVFDNGEVKIFKTKL